MAWKDSEACRSRQHCAECRLSEAFRKSIVAVGFETDTSFECPVGLPVGSAPPATHPVQLGDLVAKVAQPIAAAIDAVAGTSLKTCGGCARRRQKLNELGRGRQVKATPAEK